MSRSDAELLDDYVRGGSEPAFAELVGRYIDLVHGSAARQLSQADLADDVTQATFILLAKKAGKIRGDYLAGWLLNATRYCVADARRKAVRRHYHEHQAAAMRNTFVQEPNSSREEIFHYLDEAIGCLPPRQSTAISMRYLQNKSTAEVASAMGVSQDAVQKIIQRGLPKLRRVLSGRGLVLSEMGWLTEAMVAASRHAAPAQLAALVAKGSPSGAAIAKGAMRIIFWNKAQVALIAAATGLALSGGTALVVINHSESAGAKTVSPNSVSVSNNEKHYASPFLELSGCRIVRPVRVKIASGPVEPVAEVKAYEEEELGIDCTLTRDISEKADRADETIISAEDGSELGKQEITFTNGQGLEQHSRFLRVAPPAGDYVIRIEAMDAAKILVARRTVPLHVDPLEKTLIEVGDILPDGSIRFFGVEQKTNSGNSAISEDNLNTDSSFDAMFDASGRPIAFLTRHALSGNLVQLKLNNPVQPQQAVILGATGSIKNVAKRLSGGVLRYTEHDGDAGPIRHLNLYRLPAGAKLLSLDSPGLQQRTVDGRIQIYFETVTGANGQCNVAFRYRLAGR